jgi:carbamoyl-phosphate synthase large subunit
MPKRTDIKKVLVIGSGPIVIGQAAEFDYSGSQACKALREEGIEVVLVNSNPATIQTDKGIADKIYIEPLRAEFLEKIIAREKPDGLIATMAGQTGLNLAVELQERGALKDLEVLGTGIKAIQAGEDRQKFVEVMKKIGEPILRSVAATELKQALDFAEGKYPVILRPAFCLGGTGSGIARNKRELAEKFAFATSVSMNGQVLIEETVLGWGEFEYEAVRDGMDNCITVCSMENVDAMGIHTGESIVVAPAQTLNNVENQMLRSAALRIVRALDVKGGCNVQFALNQKTGEYKVIEVNPRLSRSSALASKATGYPIARVAAKIALGYTLDEIPNAVTKKTPACFEPAVDYIVVKIPRWPFDKFPDAKKELGTAMKSTGEVMAIGRCFEEALQKALRSLDVRRAGICLDGRRYRESEEELERILEHPTNERIFAIYDALGKGMRVREVAALTKINPWFIEKIKNILEMERALARAKWDGLGRELLENAKKFGFSDKQIAFAFKKKEAEARDLRRKMGINPVFKMVDTCAAEFEAATPYYYSAYDWEDESNVRDVKKAVVLGSGPIRIGQGIEFDYCCCHAVFALREEGVEAIMVNNNPETVSTDFDASDKLYFEPLTVEDVLNVVDAEKPEGVIVQFGGQTSINLALPLHQAGVRILGTQIEGIDVAEDRERFRQLLTQLGLRQPRNGTALDAAEAKKIAARIGYPIVVRPSYVIAGSAMRIVYNKKELQQYIERAVDVSQERPVLIDKYLENAKECEVDGVCDGKRLFVPGIMEHIELAGVHSGDSSCVTPPITLGKGVQEKILDAAEKIALALNTVGAINIQFAVQNNELYVLEANPRASRTIPYLSKAYQIPLAKVAAKIILGKKLEEMGLQNTVPNYYSVKSVVFPFNKLPGTNYALGPEMKSTGESMGIDRDFGRAYFKALLGANQRIQLQGNVAITLRREDKKHAKSLAKGFSANGFRVFATSGTARAMDGASVEVLKKISEGEPNILSEMQAGRIGLVVNTPERGYNPYADGFKIRRKSLELGVPCITTVEAALGICDAIKSAKANSLTTISLNEFHERA